VTYEGIGFKNLWNESLAEALSLKIFVVNDLEESFFPKLIDEESILPVFAGSGKSVKEIMRNRQ
jgi:hypothetical protein